jgi:hypothetical protein
VFQERGSLSADRSWQLAKKLDIQGSATLIVNGWMFEHSPIPEELDAMMKAMLCWQKSDEASARCHTPGDQT